MIIPETSKHFSEKRLGTHSTHIPHFLHTHPLKHALLPNNNKYYFYNIYYYWSKSEGEGILGVCKIYVEYVYYVYFFLIFNTTYWKSESYNTLTLFNKRNSKMPSRLLGNVSNFAAGNKENNPFPVLRTPFPRKGARVCNNPYVSCSPLPFTGNVEEIDGS